MSSTGSGPDEQRTYQLPVVGHSRRGPSRMVWIVVAAAVVVVAGVIVYLLTSGSSTVPGSTADSAAGGTSGAPNGTTGQAHVAGPGPVGASVSIAPPPPGTANFAAWRAGGGLGRVNALSTDLSTIAAADRADTAAVQAACTTLQSDIRAARAYPAMPDAQAQKSWAATQDQAGRGAADCIAGARTGDTAQRQKTTDELNAASTSLAATDERLSYFSAH